MCKAENVAHPHYNREYEVKSIKGCLFSGEMKIYSRSKTQPAFQNDYIVAGYRKSCCSFKECVQYVFVPHNEFGDIWSHFLTLVLLLAWSHSLFANGTITGDPYHYPMICYIAGCCVCMAGSSLAHTFSAMSPRAHAICFLYDYICISIYAFGADLALYFYERPLQYWFFEQQWLNLSIYVLLSVTCTTVSSLSRFHWKRYRFVIRAAVYSLPAVIGSLTLFARWYVCYSTGSSCSPESRVWHLCSYLFSFAAVFFFTTKIPERICSPGRFNYLGHSHQLFHLCISLGFVSQLQSLLVDAEARRDLLTHSHHSVSTDFMHTGAVFLGVLVANAFIFSWIARKVWAGEYVDEKAKSPNNGDKLKKG